MTETLCLFLHHWGKDADGGKEYAFDWSIGDIIDMNLSAFLKCFIKVTADISDRIRTDHICAVFKMQIQ